MAKLFLAFSIILIAWTSIFAQESISDTSLKSRSHVSFGLSGSIDYCNRWLHDVDKSEYSQTAIQLLNEREVGKSGYTIGAAMEVPFSNQSVLITGILFANKGYQSKWNRQHPAIVADAKSVYTIYYLDIPLNIQTYLNPSDKKWFLSYGLTTNILLDQKFILVAETNNQRDRVVVEQTNNFRKLNLSPEIGFGREIKLSNTINLQIAPVFRCGIISTNDIGVARYLWSFGLKAVCFWRKQ